ncbi:MAG: substrate-binding domain-containing protein, partial [Roseibium sp.]
SVARGDTPLGLVYATDAAIEPNVSVVAEIPTDSHPKIEYPAALTDVSSHPQSDAFLTYLTGTKAQNILRSLGFVADKG